MNIRVSGTSPSFEASRIDSAVQTRVNDDLCKKLSAYSGGGDGACLDPSALQDTVSALVQTKLYNMILKESEGLGGSHGPKGPKGSDGDDEDNYIRTVKADGSDSTDSSDKPKLKEVSAKEGDTLYALAKRTLKLEKDDKDLSDDEKKKLEQFMTRVAEYNGLSAGKDQKLADIKLTKDQKYQLYPPKAGSSNVDRIDEGSAGKKTHTKITDKSFERKVTDGNEKPLFAETMDFAAGTGTYTTYENGVETKRQTEVTRMPNGGFENKYTNADGNRVFRQYNKAGQLANVLTLKKNPQGKMEFYDELKGKFVGNLSSGVKPDSASSAYRFSSPSNYTYVDRF